MAHPRHDDPTRSRTTLRPSWRFALVAAPVATLFTVASGIALSASEPSYDQVQALHLNAASSSSSSYANDDRDQNLALALSRSAGRGPLGKARAERELRQSTRAERLAWFRAGKVVDHEWATAPLNVRIGPGEDFARVAVLRDGAKVPVTGHSKGPWTEIVRADRALWVHTAYLSEHRPRPQTRTVTAAGGVSDAPCPTGSEVESGLTANAIALHRAVCHAFPQVTSYGGIRADGEHSQGLALDIMIPDSSTGTAIAEWVRSNYASLHVSYIMWSRQIWSVERSSEGWRPVEDRGSPTANHEDHVHVTVF